MTAKQLVYEILKCVGHIDTITNETIDIFVNTLPVKIDADVIASAKSKIQEINSRKEKTMSLC